MNYPVKKVASVVTATILGVALSASANAQINNENSSLSMQEPVLGQLRQVGDNLPVRYVVRYKKTSANTQMKASGKAVFKSSEARAKLIQRGAKIKLDLPEHHSIAAMLTRTQLNELRNDPSVLAVELDAPRKLMSLYNDDAGDPTTTQLTPYAVYQSQANQLSLQSGQKVCIIDSGIAGSTGETGGKNNDFNWSNITGSNDSGTGNWNADGGPHGTHVAGTVAAADNGFGVIGMAPGVDLHIVKVFNAAGWGYSSDLAHAATQCTNAGANIITMSLGGGAANSTEENAFNTFTANGGLVLAAAGNDGNTTRSYPAGYDSVMMIGANDGDNAIASFSQYPSCNTNKTNCVEVTAGGVDTLSTYPSGGATVAGLSAGGNGYASSAMENTGSASGSTFDMGTAESTNSGANGKICMIDRGAISFHDKVKNCEDSGGIGAVIINNVAGMLAGTLGTTNTTTIPAVGAALEDRTALKAASTASISVGAGDYGLMSGTSMATPGVAGMAALLWSNHSSCTGTEIRNALKATASDSGSNGHDVYFGNGIVKVKAASDYITSMGCDGSGTGGNVLPVASFTKACSDLTCSFDGSASSDSDGNVASYAWNYGDGSNGSGVNASHTYASAGNYTVQLTVTDNQGGTNTTSQSVTATDPVPNNEAPTASFTNSCSELACSFNGTASSDSDGTIASYAWNFGDSSTGTGSTASHTYAAAGTYTVQLTVTDNDGASNTTSSSVTVSETPVGNNVLANGVAKTGLAASSGNQLAYTMVVPSGATDLSFVMAGGSGDADLYVRFGAAPTTSTYDCRPYKNGNSETCTISNVQAGTYHVMVRAYSTFSGVSLTGSYTEAPVGGVGGVAEETNLSGNRRAWSHYTVDIPAGMGSLTVNMSGGTGDADLYVRKSGQPTSSSYDCRPYKSGNTEACSFNTPAAGTWYISIYGYSAYSGVNLKAEWK
jgi:subtilisin family serine protease/PKD repeat protein